MFLNKSVLAEVLLNISSAGGYSQPSDGIALPGLYKKLATALEWPDNDVPKDRTRINILQNIAIDGAKSPYLKGTIYEANISDVRTGRLKQGEYDGKNEEARLGALSIMPLSAEHSPRFAADVLATAKQIARTREADIGQSVRASTIRDVIPDIVKANNLLAHSSLAEMILGIAVDEHVSFASRNAAIICAGKLTKFNPGLSPTVIEAIRPLAAYTPYREAGLDSIQIAEKSARQAIRRDPYLALLKAQVL